jgi:superoxide dismutase, Fe-Mn family
MSIELPDLPYSYAALEPFISAATLKIHHGKHHRGYVDKLNALLRDTELAESSLEAIIERYAGRSAANRNAAAVFNNAAQAWNHAFYWKSLRASSQRGPEGALAALIAAAFGGVRAFAEAFKSAATNHFGSGWAWLVADRGAPEIVTTCNADTPMVHGRVPLLVIDVWEHAYYLDHQERRAAYVAGVVDNLLDWEFAEANYQRATGNRAMHATERAGRSPAQPHL